MSEDYYAVLGLQKGASEEDIRKAYKKAAMKDHPDRNPGDKAAEERFKKANEAYAVLGDVEKRRHYDQWGAAGGQTQGGAWSGGGDPFSSFQDIFADMFGRRGAPQQRGPSKGDDVQVVMRISMKESMLGCSKEIPLDIPSNCGECGGSGARKGTSRTRCTGCNGAGHVMIRQGFMSITHPCEKCQGRGDVVETPCNTCHGRGQINKKKKINVVVPPGIDRGQQLRVPGVGVPSRDGGAPGDVYVSIDVEQVANWRREGNDLVTMQVVSFFTAATGGEIKVDLPSGEKVTVTVPPGTQPGVEIALHGRGISDVRRSNVKGNLRVLINVKVPEVITERGKILLGALEKELASPG